LGTTGSCGELTETNWDGCRPECVNRRQKGQSKGAQCPLKNKGGKREDISEKKGGMPTSHWGGPSISKKSGEKREIPRGLGKK